MYWQPRSEWKITPAAGLRAAMAMSRAAVTRLVRMCAAIAQPTTARECRPVTVARYAQPSQVLMQVASPHQRVSGSAAVKSRPIRSGAATGWSPPIVVRFHAFG